MSQFEPSSCPKCDSDNIECKQNMDGFITEGFSCVCNDCGTEWQIDIEISETITHNGKKV